MPGFRVDRVEGGFMIREIHPKNRDKRKLAVVPGDLLGSDYLTEILKRFVLHIDNKFNKTEE